MAGEVCAPAWNADRTPGRSPQFWSADQAGKAVVGKFELVAFDIPSSPNFPTREIRWELFGGAKRQTQLARGQAQSFDDAKAAAEDALRSVLVRFGIVSI